VCVNVSHHHHHHHHLLKLTLRKKFWLPRFKPRLYLPPQKDPPL
jgi:hypothetical protein